MAEIQPFLVKAVYTFAGTNNDELNFKKGDIITVTQMMDGGWWEGTLDGKTGWFPSNYTKEQKNTEVKCSKVSQGTKLQDFLINKRESMKVYRNLVLQNMIETESQHVNEMQSLMKSYIRPLLTSEILSEVQYRQLCSNIEEVIEGHVNLLNALEDCSKLPPHQQSVGGTFMQSASHLKKLHETYCSNHPKAVALLNKYREELSGFMESQGAPSPGVLILISGLSQPFRRLEKYPLLLQEMERHIEESHMDRGNTQRAIAVYSDVASSCMEIRRQKEMDLEVIMGAIQGWEGDDISKLGEILLMSPVTTFSEMGEKKDVYFVLFADTLLMLSVSLRMSAFLYEGKLPLSGLNVNKVEDNENLKNAFEITGNMIEKITVSCTTRDRQKRWLEALKRQIRASQSSISSRTQAIPLHASTSPPPIPINNQLLQPPIIHNKIWAMSCLRPYPPIRPCLALGNKEDGLISRSPRTSRRLLISGRKKEDRSYEDDALILKVIEAYCTSAKTRHTINSALLDSPQVLIAEEEKIIIEETSGNQTIVEEKSLVDTVYALKDQLKDLTEETKKLQKGLEDEHKARKKLETLVKKHFKIVEDCACEESKDV